MDATLGAIIASRTLEHRDGRKIEILFGVPRKFPDGEDFYCPFKVEGIGDGQVRRSGGVDSLQALILALQRAAMYVHALDEVKADQVIWIQGKDGLGLPQKI